MIQGIARQMIRHFEAIIEFEDEMCYALLSFGSDGLEHGVKESFEPIVVRRKENRKVYDQKVEI